MGKKSNNVADRMPTELGELKALVDEFMTKFERTENELDVLKEDQKELLEQYSDRLDMKTLKQAIRTIKIKKKVAQKDTYDTFINILDEKRNSMNVLDNKKVKVPVILYEENASGRTNLIPYIEVKQDEEMPKVLFISEYKETGEFEPSLEGDAPVVDMLIHKYVDMEFLKHALDAKTNDKVRVVLGLQPLEEAKKQGQRILNKVERKANKYKLDLQNNKGNRKTKRMFQLGNNLKEKAEAFLEENKESN